MMKRQYETTTSDSTADEYSRPRRNAAYVALAALAALLLALAAVLGAGCSQQAGAGLFEVDLGEGGSSGLATDMGASMAGKTEFTLTPDRQVVKDSEENGDDLYDTLEEWVDAVTKVTLDGSELTESPFNNWKDELESPQDDYDRLPYYDLVANEEDVTLTLPAALFDDFDDNVSTKHLVIKADGYDDVTGDLRFQRGELEQLEIRVLDGSAERGGVVQYEYDLPDDELRSLPVQSEYQAAGNCGMAGLRSYYAEGVYLTDILEAAGVDFGPGMTLQLRTGEGSSTGYYEDDPSYYPSSVWTYEELLGTTRYDYPAMWDDETTYDELGGATVYELLAADIDAWKRDDEQSKALARIIGESKVEASPLIAWRNNCGVVGWGGEDPTKQSYGSYKINPYSEYSGYTFLHGVMANEDGSVANEATTMKNSSGVFGIDIFPTPETD